MTRYLLMLSTLLLCGICPGISQPAAKDTLSFEDGIFGATYKQGDREITSEEFTRTLQTVPDSSVYQQYSSGTALRTVGNVMGFVGGFGLGYGLFSKPTNGTSVVVGVVAAVAAIVLDSSGKGKMRSAVHQYNEQPLAPGASWQQSMPAQRAVVVSVSFSL